MSPSRASRNAATALQLTRLVFPTASKRVLSGNGSEFAKHFHQAVLDQGLVH